ncbi:hypothetical protein CC1G_14018 [Coprinopsis cinerea okayama7|uniref:Uncharacterized protein n=1 Tax=Coprinopsis cinerea (strain Okayama-7 / 130 / ATCC MYA-4618 / FGSC 9003) TaxID=240176 RepID=D6RL08_COPC7|nr:hypothetical protein CC1G_14018 [Coprinopsis cinerea okayama7\|eukprot:XP_002911980.1 hypothetical protein CC1G_14018 [Coprinopsis cinerea okayama7\
MSQRPLQLDRANNAYFVVTLSQSGSLYTSPGSLAEQHPALSYVGRVGELEDTHVYSTPLNQEDVVSQFLKERRGGGEGIIHISIPEETVLEKRKKRDEL